MAKFPDLARTLPPVQVVFEPGYLSQPVVHHVYARLLPPAAPPSASPAAPPPANSAGTATREVDHVP